MRCSRREAEQYIEGGWVSVNGKVVEEPMARVTNQTVAVDPNASLMDAHATSRCCCTSRPGFETMAAPGEANKRVKPAHQLLLPAKHWAQDASGLRLLKHHFAKLTACVPLEAAASGLVVFTQDWRVLRKLTEDAAVMEQELVVEVAGEVAPGAAAAPERGPEHRRPAAAAGQGQHQQHRRDTSTRLRFALKGAHPGLIAYLCERVGLHILSIKRQRVGRVALSSLPKGSGATCTAQSGFSDSSGAEQLAARRIGDGHHAGVRDAPLHRHRVELLHQLLGAADHLHAKLGHRLGLQHAWAP